MTVRVILDGSALRGYVADDLRSLVVAELTSSVQEDAGIVGIPAASFVAAYAGADARSCMRLTHLVGSGEGVTALLPLMWPGVLDVGSSAAGLGPDGAHAVAEARTHGAYLATFEPAAYAEEDDLKNLILDLAQ
jgi:hypothetical protein